MVLDMHKVWPPCTSECSNSLAVLCNRPVANPHRLASDKRTGKPYAAPLPCQWTAGDRSQDLFDQLTLLLDPSVYGRLIDAAQIEQRDAVSCGQPDYQFRHHAAAPMHRVQARSKREQKEQAPLRLALRKHQVSLELCRDRKQCR